MAHRLQESQAVVAKALLTVQTIGQQLVVQARRGVGASGIEASKQPAQQHRGHRRDDAATSGAAFGAAAGQASLPAPWPLHQAEGSIHRPVAPTDSLTVGTARVDARCS